jgi:hypothetical protein
MAVAAPVAGGTVAHMVARVFIAWFLVSEVVLFSVASLIHSGIMVPGFAHPLAKLAEAVCAAVLFAGLVYGLARPASARRAALLVDVLVLLAVLAALIIFALGIGPQSTLDLGLLVAMLISLLVGFVFILRSESW